MKPVSENALLQPFHRTLDLIERYVQRMLCTSKASSTLIHARRSSCVGIWKSSRPNTCRSPACAARGTWTSVQTMLLIRKAAIFHIDVCSDVCICLDLESPADVLARCLSHPLKGSQSMCLVKTPVAAQHVLQEAPRQVYRRCC